DESLRQFLAPAFRSLGGFVEKDGSMSGTETRAIVVERVLPYPPEKIWRCLTEATLIEEWLMKSDFVPRLGARFTFRGRPIADWDGVVHCAITAFEPPRHLAYLWKGGALDTVVEWTLSPDAGGTRVRMEHSGFRDEDEVAYQAMSKGWQQVLDRFHKTA